MLHFLEKLSSLLQVSHVIFIYSVLVFVLFFKFDLCPLGENIHSHQKTFEVEQLKKLTIL